MNKLLQVAINKLNSGWTGLPQYGCCNFVTTCLKEANLFPKVIDWIPTFLEECKYPRVQDIQPGDVVIFNYTYDAEPPAGIGPEDTMTHIGIAENKDTFIHYSGGKVKRSKFAGWNIHSILRPPEIIEADFVGKIFFHDGKLSFVLNGVTYDVLSISNATFKFNRRKER